MKESNSGSVLYNAWCNECDKYHPQWKYPCICENGKVLIKKDIYELCNKCNGKGYLNDY